MPLVVHPPDVIRLLSFHGPVELWTGSGDSWKPTRLSPAPFEDTIYLFAQRGSPALDGLEDNCRCQLVARHSDGDYALRMDGRAHSGRNFAGHPERRALEPWLDEDAQPNHLVVVPFVAEHIDLVRDDPSGRVHFHGPTPAGRQRPRAVRTWLAACFRGVTLLLLAVAGVGSWLYLAPRQGVVPWRITCLLLCWLGSATMLAGVRLLLLAAAFRGFRSHATQDADVGPLAEALIAPNEARTVGAVLAFVGFVVFAVVGTVWTWDIAGAAFAASGAWLLGPAGLLHLHLAKGPAESGSR